MSIVNRRNAMIGWMTWKAAKWLAKDKARLSDHLDAIRQIKQEIGRASCRERV